MIIPDCKQSREGGVPLTEPKEILPEIRMCRLISHEKAHKMELSSKINASKKLSVRARERGGKE